MKHLFFITLLALPLGLSAQGTERFSNDDGSIDITTDRTYQMIKYYEQGGEMIQAPGTEESAYLFRRFTPGGFNDGASLVLSLSNDHSFAKNQMVEVEIIYRDDPIGSTHIGSISYLQNDFSQGQSLITVIEPRVRTYDERPEICLLEITYLIIHTQAGQQYRYGFIDRADAWAFQIAASLIIGIPNVYLTN